MALSTTLFLIFSCGILLSEAYTVYRPTVQPIHPRGFKISIPAEEGITLVAFHININKEFDGLESGSIAKDILKVRNGRYTYTDTLTKLKKGDVLNFWVYVIYEGLGYHLMDQEYTVNEFYDANGNKIADVSVDDRNSNPNPNQGCQQSTTKVLEKPGQFKTPCRNELIFQENFSDTNGFRNSQWQIVEQFSDEPDYEFVTYRDSGDNVGVRDNNLVLSPKIVTTGSQVEEERELNLPRCTGRKGSIECHRHSRGWNILPPISSGRVNTKKFFNFVYGKVEIRAKFPKGDWVYPLLMLEPLENAGEVVQLRVASSPGNSELVGRNNADLSGKNLWGGVIEQNPESDRMVGNRVLKHSNEFWSQNFHDYQLEWTPDRVILKVDGVKYDEQYVRLSSDKPFYITLGVAVGGYGEFPDNCRSSGYIKPWRNVEAKALYKFYKSHNHWSKSWNDNDKSLKVKSVKVWAL